MTTRIIDELYAYFNETTVHGFHYIVNGRNWIERLLWASLILCGFIVSSIIIHQSLLDWSRTPLQTTIEKVSLPIEGLNYPAITVCHPDELQMPRRNRWMYLEKLLNLIDVEKGDFSRFIYVLDTVLHSCALSNIRHIVDHYNFFSS